MKNATGNEVHVGKRVRRAKNEDMCFNGAIRKGNKKMETSKKKNTQLRYVKNMKVVNAFTFLSLITEVSELFLKSNKQDK